MERNPNEPCLDQMFNYNNALIKPHIKEKTKKDFKVKYVLIDSRDRNTTKYPNSNDYQIMLNEPIKDVVEVELIQAHIPNTAYVINNNNNRIYYYIAISQTDAYDGSSILYQATIEPGDWDATNIADRITEAFRENSHDISVYYSDTNNKFTFVYNDDSTTSNIAIGSDKNIYLDFRKTNDNVNGAHLGIPVQVIKQNYDQNGNEDTLYKDKTMGEILGFTKNYHSTDANCIVDYIGNFSVYLYDESDMLISSSDSVSYFIINLSKNDIKTKNPDFKFTIGSIIKVYYSEAGGYITGIIDNFMATHASDGDRIKCIWLSGLGKDDATNEYTGLQYISSTIGDMCASLGGDDYILLREPNLERYEGRNTTIEKSYAKLHLGNSTRNVFFGRIANFSNNHVIEPTIQKFDRFNLQFTDYYGNPYDFNNAENSLIFAVKYKAQPGKYDF